jgi:DNA gyrase subunit B
MKEQEIRLLEDREHCRIRKGMYIPNVNYFVYELVDNCVDQFMAGYGDTINVLIDEDGSLMVQDFGQGMPIAESKDIKGMSQAELALSRLQAGGKFEDNGVKSSGLNGVGASCINFLSEYFLVRISKLGRLYGLDFSQGIVSEDHLYEMEMTDEYPESGTLIMTIPDPEIWIGEEIIYDINAINSRLKQLAYLNPGLTINFQVNDYNGISKDETYNFPEGVKTYVEDLTANKELIFDPMYITKEINDIEIFLYNMSDNEKSDNNEVEVEDDTNYGSNIVVYQSRQPKDPIVNGIPLKVKILQELHQLYKTNLYCLT